MTLISVQYSSRSWQASCGSTPNTEVWAYGSRVTFKTRHGSDLDMVAFSSKGQTSSVCELREALIESNLPFRVDLLVWDNMPEHFKPNIKQTYFVLQEGNKSEVG